jgi:hypothetical protein
MEDQKKSQPKGPDCDQERYKPFVVQVFEALIDGAAELAKNVIFDPVARITKSNETVISSAAESENTAGRKASERKPVAERNTSAAKASTKITNTGHAKRATIKRAATKTKAVSALLTKRQRKTYPRKRR